MMKKNDLVSSYFHIIPISKIFHRGKNKKKNPVTSPQRRFGCKEGTMYEENGLCSYFVGIHWY